MDISADIVAAGIQMAQDRTQSAVQLRVLKKANELAAQSALQLLQALPQPAGSSNPPQLGNSVDTFA